MVDAFVEELDFRELGFEGAEPACTGRPAYHPGVLLKIYIYGYLNRIQSSRRLEGATRASWNGWHPTRNTWCKDPAAIRSTPATCTDGWEGPSALVLRLLLQVVRAHLTRQADSSNQMGVAGGAATPPNDGPVSDAVS